MPAETSVEPRIVRVFHPTIQVPDLAEAEAWFARVFGRPSTPLTAMLPSTPNYPTEYSAFVMVQEVMLDLVDPSKHTIGGVQRYPSVTQPDLKSIGWYVDGMTALYFQLKDHGIRSMDLWNKIADGDTPPLSPGGDVITYMTVPGDTGLQYQFMREGPFPIDPRTTDGWTQPPVPAGDPLGIERCYCHTILTLQPDRARHVLVTALGGRVVLERPNPILGGTSTFIALADAIFEIVVPDAGSEAFRRLSEKDGLDSYHAIAWKVADLAAAERHLIANGVRIRTKTEDAIETEAETSLGVPWLFTDAALPA